MKNPLVTRAHFYTLLITIGGVIAAVCVLLLIL